MSGIVDPKETQVYRLQDILTAAMRFWESSTHNGAGHRESQIKIVRS